MFTYKILEEGALKIFTDFLLQKHTLRSSIYYKTLNEGALNIVTDFFLFFFRKTHFKRSIFQQNSEEECLKPCYVFFYVRGDSSVHNFSQVWVMFFYNDKISVKEGADLETYEHHDDFIDQCLSKRCDGCCILLYTKNNFNYKERICDRCYKIF